MTWSWFERAKENDTDWLERLSGSDGRPTFEEISAAATEVLETPRSRLVISTYDPYVGEIYTKRVRVDAVEDSKIIGSDGQTRIFVLPDLTAGHFDTQGGTDRMPDLVIDLDVET